MKLYQKRGEAETAGEKSFEFLDYQIEALDQLAKGSSGYRQIFDGKDQSAYSLMSKGMVGYQSLQTKEVQAENDEKRIHIDKEHDLQWYSKKLSEVVTDMSLSVRKGIFGRVKANSRQYTNMVQSLYSLLENPISVDQTQKQKEDLNRAYELCQEYVRLRTGARTSEGKKRLGYAREAIRLLKRLDPKLEERQAANEPSRKQVSIRELEQEAGHKNGPSAVVRKEANKNKTVETEKTRKRGL